MGSHFSCIDKDLTRKYKNMKIVISRKIFDTC